MQNYTSKDFQTDDQTLSYTEVLKLAAMAAIEASHGEPIPHANDWWGCFTLDDDTYSIDYKSMKIHGDSKEKLNGRYRVDVFKCEGDNNTLRISFYLGVPDTRMTKELPKTYDTKYMNLVVKVDISELAARGISSNEVMAECDYSFSYDGVELETEIIEEI